MRRQQLTGAQITALLDPPTDSRAGTAGISTVFFCFSKNKKVQKKHRNYEEPPFAIVGAGDTLARCRKKFFPRCRRKIEMTPGAQSRDDTRLGGGHDERDCVRSEGEQRI